MRFRVLVFVALSLLGQIDVACAEPRAWICANSGDLVRLYRYSHRNPELSFQERATASCRSSSECSARRTSSKSSR